MVDSKADTTSIPINIPIDLLRGNFAKTVAKSLLLNCGRKMVSIVLSANMQALNISAVECLG